MRLDICRQHDITFHQEQSCPLCALEKAHQELQGDYKELDEAYDDLEKQHATLGEELDAIRKLAGIAPRKST